MSRTPLRWLPGAVIAALLIPDPAAAQPVNARHYTVADGLGENVVYAIQQDSRGYVWIGTYEGLTRFDGHTFTNYDTAKGLPHPIVHSITEDRDQRLWVGLFRGLVRVSDATAAAAFHVEPIAAADDSYVGGVLIANDGAVWFDGEDALVRASNGADGRLGVERVRPLGERDHRSRTLKDRRGRLWFVLDRRILLVDGRTISEWTAADETGAAVITGITQDAAGRILLANQQAIFEFVEGARDGRPGTFRRVSLPDIDGETVETISAATDSGVWIGTARGLLFWDGATLVRRVGIAGLETPVLVVHEDRDRNVWVGTAGNGVFVIPSERIADYTPAPQMLAPPFRWIFESADGRVLVNADGGASVLADDPPPAVPASLAQLAARAKGKVVLDPEGYWWFGGGGTLTRVRATLAADATPETMLSGLAANPAQWTGPVPSIDAAGNIWATGPEDSIYRLRRTGPGTFETERIRLGANDIFPGRIEGDRAGNAWIISHLYLIRRRADGRIDRFTPQPGLPETLGRSILLDSRGWLWVGLRYGGVSVTRDPAADRPVFENFSIATGFASNTAWALCEDRRGRIYIGSSRGLDRFDPLTGSIHHLSTRDGLASGAVTSCRLDRRGDLWVTTMNGVSRLSRMNGDAAAGPPGVFFTRLRVSGQESPVGQRGAAILGGYVVPASANDVVAEFVAPAPGRALRYQYRLEGADQAWSEPTLERSVHLARMAAGRYRLHVRAVDEGGKVSPSPAVLEFRVLPPFWRQWWFVTAALVVAAGAAFGLHRMKLRQVLALERVRRQVALDLHDDIGSGLTQIALMSEVARRGAAAPVAATFAETADLARAMRSSMSDIVWAVDPRHDHLRDLVDRMRDAAQAMATGAGVALAFQVDDETRIDRVELPPDRRRHILLLFKEAITNAVKHAGASRIAVEVGVAGGALLLTVRDDGRGFDPASARAGHGLHSMRTRADELRATLEIQSAPGQGTTITAEVPIASWAA